MALTPTTGSSMLPAQAKAAKGTQATPVTDVREIPTPKTGGSPYSYQVEGGKGVDMASLAQWAAPSVHSGIPVGTPVPPSYESNVPPGYFQQDFDTPWDQLINQYLQTHPGASTLEAVHETNPYYNPGTIPTRPVGYGEKTSSTTPVTLQEPGRIPIGDSRPIPRTTIPEPVVHEKPASQMAALPGNPSRTAPLDEELMLAAQILDDEDYAAYLNERRRGGSPL